MSNTDLETTILGNPIPCFLLDRILNEKLDYLIQPICGSDKKKFVNPVNHQGGGVECVVSFEDLKKQQTNKFTCPACKQKNIVPSSYYFDLQLDQIIKSLKDQFEYNSAQCIQMFPNGSWVVLYDNYKESYQIQELLKKNPIMKEIDRCQENIITKFKKKGMPQQFQLIIDTQDNQDIIDQLQQSVYIQNITVQNAGPLLIQSTQLLNGEIQSLDITFLKTFEHKLLPLAIRSQDKRIQSYKKQGKNVIFSKISYFYYHSPELLVIIGSENEKVLPKVYVASFIDYLTNYNDDKNFQYIYFDEINSLQFSQWRHNYGIYHHNNYLYLVGGADLSQSGGLFGIYTHASPVSAIQRVNIEDLKMRKGSWQYVTNLPQSHFLLMNGYARLNDDIVLFGGQQQSASNLSNQVFSVNLQSFKFSSSNNIPMKPANNPFLQAISIQSEFATFGGIEHSKNEVSNNSVTIYSNYNSGGKQIGTIDVQLNEVEQCKDYINCQMNQQILQEFSKKFNKNFKHLIRFYLKNKGHIPYIYGVTEDNKLIYLDY